MPIALHIVDHVLVHVRNEDETIVYDGTLVSYVRYGYSLV